MMSVYIYNNDNEFHQSCVFLKMKTTEQVWLLFSILTAVFVIIQKNFTHQHSTNKKF